MGHLLNDDSDVIMPHQRREYIMSSKTFQIHDIIHKIS